MHAHVCTHPHEQLPTLHTDTDTHRSEQRKKSHLLVLLKDFLTYLCIEIPPFTHLKFLRHVESSGSFFLFTSPLATKFFTACETITLKAEKKTSQIVGHMPVITAFEREMAERQQDHHRCEASLAYAERARDT